MVIMFKNKSKCLWEFKKIRYTSKVPIKNDLINKFKLKYYEIGPIDINVIYALIEGIGVKLQFDYNVKNF